MHFPGDGIVVYDTFNRERYRTDALPLIYKIVSDILMCTVTDAANHTKTPKYSKTMCFIDVECDSPCLTESLI
jgi:hypothetical protein